MHYGYWAEFALWPTGLVIALVSSFFGFIFAAPGAVYIYSQYMDDKTNGIISICGPLVNIVLALIFIAVGSSLGSYAYTGTGSLIAIICLFGTRINAFLALFNLLPQFFYSCFHRISHIINKITIIKKFKCKKYITFDNSIFLKLIYKCFYEKLFKI